VTGGTGVTDRVLEPSSAVGPASPVATNGDRRPLSILIGLEGLALGGCPINALDLGRTLRGRGHRVAVFAVDEDVRVSLIPYAEASGFDVTVLPARSSVLARAWQVRRLAQQHSAAVVHLFAPWLGVTAVGVHCSRRPRATVVTNWMMHNVSYTPAHTPLILGTRKLQREAQATHRSQVWLLEPPVDLVADAPDQELGARFRRETGIGADEIAVVIVSRLDSHMKAEGIGYALDAVESLDLPHLRLVVVGDGNASGDLRRRAADVNQKLGRPAVLLTGALHDPRPAYAGADVVMGMGGSALRALAHGKPLIVLGERGFAQVFDRSSEEDFAESGFYGDEPTTDPVAHLAALLVGVLPPERRRELGELGLARVHARYGLDAAADRLEIIYRTSLEQLPSMATRSTSALYVLVRAQGHAVRTRLGRALDAAIGRRTTGD
jgi:glycosyltransferase involved in cell wall biosynthesis